MDWTKDLKPGDIVLYRNGNGYALGRIKRIADEGDAAFVWYSDGETASRTPFSALVPLQNAYAVTATSFGGEDAKKLFDAKSAGQPDEEKENIYMDSKNITGSAASESGNSHKAEAARLHYYQTVCDKFTEAVNILKDGIENPDNKNLYTYAAFPAEKVDLYHLGTLIKVQEAYDMTIVRSGEGHIADHFYDMLCSLMSFTLDPDARNMLETPKEGEPGSFQRIVDRIRAGIRGEDPEPDADVPVSIIETAEK